MKAQRKRFERYIEVFIILQKKKDHIEKKLLDPSSLKAPLRRWGSLETDFIVILPNTKKVFDIISTLVYILSNRFHFIPCKLSDTAVYFNHEFFTHIFKHHGMSDNVFTDRDPKFTSKVCLFLMEICGVGLEMSSILHPQTDEYLEAKC